MSYLHDPCGETVPTIALAFVHLQICPRAALTYIPTPASRRRKRTTK